jgi:hypothetical protein
MKKTFYYMISFGLLLASCNSDSSSKKSTPMSQSAPDTSQVIPFKRIREDTAKLMIDKYNKRPITADTSYREIPRVWGYDAKTIQSFTAPNAEGEVVSAYFIIAAYLDKRPVLSKNTVILLVVRNKEKPIITYYDLRDPIKQFGVGGGGVCPPPDDCQIPGQDTESVK